MKLFIHILARTTVDVLLVLALYAAITGMHLTLPWHPLIWLAWLIPLDVLGKLWVARHARQAQEMRRQ